MSDNNTPSAFPIPGRTELRDYPGPSKGGTWHEHKIPPSNGMDLRDYFAAQALAGLTATEGGVYDQEGAKKVANRSYRIADAMMVARKNPEPEPTTQDYLDDQIDLR